MTTGRRGPTRSQLVRARGNPKGRGTAPNAFAASAKRLPLDDAKALSKHVAKRLEWQDEAWDYFDEVPEIKYSIWFLGNAAGKIRLFAAVRPSDNPEADPVPVGDGGVDAGLATRATLEVERLKSPVGGPAEITRELNMNLEVAAEAYLVGLGPRIIPAKGTTPESIQPEEWSIRSVSEVDVEQSGSRPTYTIVDRPGGTPTKLDPILDTIIRIWQRHPRYTFLPDNNMRGVLDECARLVLLGNQISAEAKSQMSAGIFTIPNELSFGPLEETEPEDGESEGDPLDEELESALTDPVEDPSSPSVVNPMSLRGPAEYLKPEYVRQIVFARPASAVLEERIQKRIERIARGMNLPVEVVMGHQQTTFANAQQVDEDTFEDHLQPRCELICDALTVGFLQPNLIAAGYDPAAVEDIIVWYDAGRLLRQVDPAENVAAALADGLISDEAGRRYWGFSEDDAPTPEERLIRTIMHLRTFDPGVSTAILKLLGVPLDIPKELPGNNAPARAQGDVDAELTRFVLELVHQRAELATEVEKIAASRQSKGQRKAQANVGRRFMDIDRDLRTKLLAAADRAVTRALERAGNRLKGRNKQRGKQDVRAFVTGVHPMYAAATLGPRLVAAAGFTDDDLIGGDAWDDLERQFFAWGANAQKQALGLVRDVVGLTDANRGEIAASQVRDLDSAWDWMKDALHDLAVAKLYQPDPHDVDLGEFDPTSKVPTGLIRQAMARAGGASGLTTVQGGNPYVVLNNGQPPGGIATGELVGSALTGAGASIEGYEWVYGPAYRAHPFEEHEDLDGTLFTEFDDDALSADGSWIGSDYFYPGDHDGCACDVSPVILGPDDVVFDAASGDAHYADDQGE